MRRFLICFALIPGTAFADKMIEPSAPTAVVVYPGQAVVTREIELSLPAGEHEVILPDLPGGGVALRSVAVQGAHLLRTGYRFQNLPPRDIADSSDVTAAQSAITEIEERITAKKDEIETAALPRTAISAQLGFLNGLADNTALPGDAPELRALSLMIREETLAATKQDLATTRAVRTLTEDLDDLEKELAKAQQALAALRPDGGDRSEVTLFVRMETAGTATALVEYAVRGDWRPSYDVFLDRDRDEIRIARSLLVSNYSNEDWTNVSMQVSTAMPSDQTAPSSVWPERRRIEDPQQLAAKRVTDQVSGVARSVAPAPVIAEESVSVGLAASGLSVTYTLNDTVTVTPNAEFTRLPIAPLTFETAPFAFANPRSDETAFLMAEVTNTSQEPLLFSDTASFYVNGSLVGMGPFPEIAAGDETELPFGPIETLRLSYATLDRNEGDRGIISRSNTQSETRRMEIQNLGSKGWTVRVQHAVPYSEQEDLEIDWSATPKPDAIDVDDRKGILEWEVNMAPGDTESVSVNLDLLWPEGKVLR